MRKESRTDEDTARVVNLLADSKHSVPFESIIFRFWMRVPIFVDRQYMTHRLQSASGMSGRYRTMPSDFYELPEDVLAVLKEHSPNSIATYASLSRFCNNMYREALDKLKKVKEEGNLSSSDYKRCREVLRGVLPQGNMTERVSVINLRSFSNFYKLRSKEDAQPEIQFLAKGMLERIVERGQCPIAIEAVSRNNWVI